MWRLSPGLLTCSWDGGHGEWVRCRTWELCRPRPRWMLQHSSQINTPLLTEAQRGSGTGCKRYSTSQRDCIIADDGAQKTYNHHRSKPIRSEGAISNTQPILNSRFLCLLHIRKPVSWMRRGGCLTRNHSFTPPECILSGWLIIYGLALTERWLKPSPKSFWIRQVDLITMRRENRHDTSYRKH